MMGRNLPSSQLSWTIWTWSTGIDGRLENKYHNHHGPMRTTTTRRRRTTRNAKNENTMGIEL